ncbi:MAG: sugar ABC transporter permease [Propionibacteriaceae bacterium]|nr:sugar ABC transporter permease [Propionibacteriaceae bacterium]
MTTSVETRKRTPLSHRLAPWLLMLPAFLFIMIALGYPMLRQFIMSFQEFGLAQQFGKAPEWVGLNNYIAILKDPYFWTVLVKSIGFAGWTAALTMILAIVVALLMRAASPMMRTIMNVVLIVVWAMPLLASLTVWQWLVDPNFGLLNFFLSALGLTQFQGFSWLASSFWSFYLIASLIIIWASVPLASITIYSALTQVDDAVIEAAEIDGASYFQRLRHVIFPTIANVIALIGILQIIWDLKVFTHIHVLQQSGGITTETNLLGTYVYQVGVSQGNYGSASAIATIILLVTVLITAQYLRMLFKKGDA